MDYMEKITELRASKAKLNEQAQALVTEGKFEDANKLADQMEGINKQIQAVERLLDESRKHAVPLDGKYDGILHDEGTGTPKDGKKDAVKPFATLGEQLKAVYDLRKGDWRKSTTPPASPAPTARTAASPSRRTSPGRSWRAPCGRAPC